VKSNIQLKERGTLYVQYGAGRICPSEWVNFDVSPTLRIQRIPLAGKWLAKRAQGFNFPDALRFGDIVKGLPVRENSCKGVFCAHVLEHLTRENAEKALANTYRILQPGGVFRCQLPDLKIYAERYLNRVKEGNADAADLFMREACLGVEDSHDGWRGPIRKTFGNYLHLWMWDALSFEKALKIVGFKDIRSCKMGDAEDPMFKLVERESRFRDALSYECHK
jgi:SAM-dependent methyltransferase